MKKFTALFLATCLALTMSVASFADEVNTDGGSGSTPVYLSSTADGTLDDAPSATAMSVTIPTALPMAMSQTGDVTTATDCKIINNSYGAVRVKSVTISTANGWQLTRFGDKSVLADEKVDANKLGFSLSLGGGNSVGTTDTDSSKQFLIASPISGCYMSGIGNTSGNTISVEYDAIVTPLSAPVTNANIANVVFVIEWDTVA